MVTEGCPLTPPEEDDMFSPMSLQLLTWALSHAGVFSQQQCEGFRILFWVHGSYWLNHRTGPAAPRRSLPLAV